jgi:signal peptidase I
MFDKALKYSYAAQKHERHKLLRIILIVVLLYLLYNVICGLFISVWALRNDTMQPGLRAGDRFLAVSPVLPSLLAKLKQTDAAIPFKRGNIVIIDARKTENSHWLPNIADNLVRFASAQQLGLHRNEEHLYIKRLIALPGDEISMVNFVLRVRPSGSSYTLTEFELSEKPYYPNIPQVPALWDASIPFSGHMEPRMLGPGEYFVVSDDRENTGDSRTWGPVSAKEIIGRPIFRFWPLTRIGRP